MPEERNNEMEHVLVESTTSERSTEGVDRVTLFFGVIAAVVALDFATKIWIQRTFHLYEQVDVIGDYVRLTYIFNPGAAFGIHVGEYSRVVFLTLSLIALIALIVMYWSTPATDRLRLSSIALICAGAIGNLIDRIRSERGVVDFVDVGIGSVRWPVFNVADMAVTVGAVLLAISLWQEERRPRPGGATV